MSEKIASEPSESQPLDPSPSEKFRDWLIKNNQNGSADGFEILKAADEIYGQELQQARSENEGLRQEVERRKQIIDGVKGALADAGGDILCQREDGNYGESVRQVVKERDEAIDDAQKSAAGYSFMVLKSRRHKIDELTKQLTTAQARIAELEAVRIDSHDRPQVGSP